MEQVRGPRVNRRRVLGGMAGGGAALALGGGRLQDALAARKAPAVIQTGGKLTYWGGLIFSDEANKLLEDEINAWGEANGVEAEVVMINQNETNQRVSAAVESDTMPDALDLGLDLLLLLSGTGQLEPVDDVFAAIGDAHGGWFPSIESASSPDLTGGVRTGVPFGASGNMLFSRGDVLAEAGLTPPPTTWQEVSDWSAQAQNPPAVFGMGFALSNVGDGNTMTSVMQSYGGRVADDTGKIVTLKSEETRTFLQWVTDAYAAGLFPPGATTWDGAGDNTAYQSGQAIFIANTGSVYLAIKDEDPELAESTVFSALPAGPNGTISPIGPNFRAIPKKDGSNVENAKALFQHLANVEFIEAYYNVAIYGPVLQDQRPFPIFQTPVHGGLLNLVENGTAPGFPDVFNPAYAEFQTNFLVPKMIQRVVIDDYTLDEAMDEAQAAAEAIYAKYE
jgi:multiple sugar transport system substrate-binding protein